MKVFKAPDVVLSKLMKIKPLDAITHRFTGPNISKKEKIVVHVH